jgi:hypothetical protein
MLGTGIVMVVEVAPPTTNSRVYDVAYGSNLLDGLWWPMGLNVTGRADGAGMSFTLTNRVDDHLHYRTRVTLP